MPIELFHFGSLGSLTPLLGVVKMFARKLQEDGRHETIAADLSSPVGDLCGEIRLLLEEGDGAVEMRLQGMVNLRRR